MLLIEHAPYLLVTYFRACTELGLSRPFDGFFSHRQDGTSSYQEVFKAEPLLFSTEGAVTSKVPKNSMSLYGLYKGPNVMRWQVRIQTATCSLWESVKTIAI